MTDLTYTIGYYLKNKTKYPARIMVMFGTFPMRNRRNMGIISKNAFHSRAMTEIEKREQDNSSRMVFYQYHSITYMICDEQQATASKEQILRLLNALKDDVEVKHAIPDYFAIDRIIDLISQDTCLKNFIGEKNYEDLRQKDGTSKEIKKGFIEKILKIEQC